jgi:hypothetical protein
MITASDKIAAASKPVASLPGNVDSPAAGDYQLPVKAFSWLNMSSPLLSAAVLVCCCFGIRCRQDGGLPSWSRRSPGWLLLVRRLLGLLPTPNTTFPHADVTPTPAWQRPLCCSLLLFCSAICICLQARWWCKVKDASRGF